jgi:hypothetical protein
MKQTTWYLWGALQKLMRHRQSLPTGL